MLCVSTTGSSDTGNAVPDDVDPDTDKDASACLLFLVLMINYGNFKLKGRCDDDDLQKSFFKVTFVLL
jgi:hypothetical protein